MTAAMHERDLALPPENPADKESLEQARRFIASIEAVDGTPRLVGPDSERIELPKPVYDIVRQVVDSLSQGYGIAVMPYHTKLTTQEAADFLGIPRPALLELIESGELPCDSSGRHRRVKLADVIEFERNLRRRQDDALQEMADEGQRTGGYEATKDNEF